MRVTPIPCLQDNYAYLVICEETGQAAVVDPSEAAPVLRALQEAKVELVRAARELRMPARYHWSLPRCGSTIAHQHGSRSFTERPARAPVHRSGRLH